MTNLITGSSNDLITVKPFALIPPQFTSFRHCNLNARKKWFPLSMFEGAYLLQSATMATIKGGPDIQQCSGQLIVIAVG